MPLTSIPIPLPPIDHATAVHLASTAATTAHAYQIAAEALLGLIPEATAKVEFAQEEGAADDELIVGLVDSLLIGNSNDESMEDPAGDAADDNGADGNREDRNAAVNGLRQMDQWLHRFNILESFFDDVAGNIEWGGEDYDVTSLFDVSDLAEGSDMGPSDGSGMAATEVSM